MACKEAKAFDKRVVLLMTLKHDECYSKIVGFVRAWMSLAIIHLNPLMLRGAKVGHVFGILLHCA